MLGYMVLAVTSFSIMNDEAFIGMTLQMLLMVEIAGGLVCELKLVVHCLGMRFRLHLNSRK